MTEEIRFEDLPKVTKMMMTKLEELCAKMDKIIPTVEEPIDRWFTVDELREYLPEHPARQTVYGWTSNAIIPFHKKGKSLRFKKSEIDKWLNEGYCSDISEIERMLPSGHGMLIPIWGRKTKTELWVMIILELPFHWGHFRRKYKRWRRCW